jgi:2,4-dienoyl-CoA reductase-like NADH-dependent reductase (Old Yellow Enzyme family)
MNDMVTVRPREDPVRSLDALFEPFTFKSLKLQNRMVMAPMGRNMASGGVVPPTYKDYFRRRIEGGASLCISEASAIDHPVASSDTEHCNFFGEVSLAAWTDVVREVHQAGGHFMQQIWHAGLLRGKGPDPKLTNDHLPSIGPSGWALPLVHTFGWQAAITEPQQLNKPMSQAEIDAVIGAFGKAAADAKRIGCDGIHIHAAHGYLIDEFFWDKMNLRADKYGGDLAARTRFAVEVIQECRRRVGPDYPIFFRYSQFKQQDYKAKLAATPQELERLLAPLSDAGVDLFDCSQRRFWEPEFAGSDLNLAGWTKKLSGKPSMTVGSVGLEKANFVEGEFMSLSDSGLGIGRLNTLVDMLERGDFDLVAIGRAIVTNPDLPNLVKARAFDKLKAYSNMHLASLD